MTLAREFLEKYSSLPEADRDGFLEHIYWEAESGCIEPSEIMALIEGLDVLVPRGTEPALEETFFLLLSLVHCSGMFRSAIENIVVERFDVLSKQSIYHAIDILDNSDLEERKRLVAELADRLGE
ncbi:hypothetical protein [Lysobacter capsici]|uniref:hypothetical protein n=1 Tax=Lysobacter capsici TaxID=435897 RepID=UPI000BBB018B|nr:hypothetical protein [Lysobacter capsici]ATE70872.1 hypothetical protein CNO08_05530 [Lysobacter capsici]